MSEYDRKFPAAFALTCGGGIALQAILLMDIYPARDANVAWGHALALILFVTSLTLTLAAFYVRYNDQDYRYDLNFRNFAASIITVLCGVSFVAAVCFTCFSVFFDFSCTEEKIGIGVLDRICELRQSKEG